MDLANGMAMLSDFTGWSDPNDFYSITLDERTNLTIDLTDLTGNANLRLLDRSGATTLALSLNGGANDDQIIATNLASDDYLIRVYPVGENVDYKLTVNATSADQGGDTPATATDLDLTGGMAMLEDFVGGGDANDFYRLSLAEASDVTVGLTQLTGNANLRLLDSTGSTTLALSLQGGANDENLVINNLPTGDYLIRVYAVGDDADYKLAVNTAPSDQGGDTPATATDLDLSNGMAMLNDFVGATDANDFYRISLAETSDVTVDLNQLTGNANLRLLDSTGSTTLGLSLNAGVNAEQIQVANLPAGDYLVRAYPVGENASYKLAVSATRDQGGDSLAAASTLNVAPGVTTINDSISSFDGQDFFKFTLASTTAVTLNLTNLAANLNLRLLNDVGGTIAGSFQTGADDEQITQTLAAGTYAIRVYQVGSATTNYTLNLTT